MARLVALTDRTEAMRCQTTETSGVRIIRSWFVNVDGVTWTIRAEVRYPDSPPYRERDLGQIVDSIKFEWLDPAGGGGSDPAPAAFSCRMEQSGLNRNVQGAVAGTAAEDRTHGGLSAVIR